MNPNVRDKRKRNKKARKTASLFIQEGVNELAREGQEAPPATVKLPTEKVDRLPKGGNTKKTRA